MRSDGNRTKRTLLGLNEVDRRSTRRSNHLRTPGRVPLPQAALQGGFEIDVPANDTGSPNGRISVAQKPPKPFLRSIQ